MTSGVEQIRQKMLEIYQKDEELHRIDTNEIVRELEPLFVAQGYRAHREGEPQRIMIQHDSGVGDFINLSPSIREIRRAYPDAYITLVVYSRGRDLAATCPYADQMIVNPRLADWRNPMAMFRWNIDFVQKLLPMHYDICFNFVSWGSAVMLSYLCGAARRIGFSAETGGCGGAFPYAALEVFLTDRVPRKARGTHSVYSYLSLIEPIIGHAVNDCQTEVWFLSQEKERWQKKLQEQVPPPPRTGVPVRWMAVVLGGTDGRKQWPVASYVELLQLIREKETDVDVRFLVIGGSENRNDGDHLAAGLPEHVVWNIAGSMNYRESVAALSCCSCYIGNDTGLMHAAAAVGLPVLTPNCYAAELPMTERSNPPAYYPFGVPAVIVLPAHLMPECQRADAVMGCAQPGHPHCICQIPPALMLKGYCILKEMIREKQSGTILFYETEDMHQEKVTVMKRLSGLFPEKGLQW